jgi:glycosyltransferase involved in cell wall biosynthesis
VLVGKIDPTAQSWLPRYEGLFRHIPYLAHPALCRLYQRAHILCQPSLAEGFSLTVLEALSCGTPVLTTPNSGAEGVLRPGMDGFVVKAGDITALTERLIYCEKHIDEVMAMRVHARETAEMHTWSHFRQSLIHHLVDFPDARHARGDLSECLLSEGSAYDY